MGSNSRIEWTHHTFNPWWGCQRVSPGCTGCYAEALAKRFRHNVWGATGHSPRRFFGDAHWAEPLVWNRLAEVEGERKRVFCASMADVFEDYRILDESRARLWELIEQTPHLDWLLLTKRPELMTTLTPESWRKRWPDNAWAMTSVENQEWADKRVPELVKVPARVRGLSCEPLLGPVDLSAHLHCCAACGAPRTEWKSCSYCKTFPDARGVDWVIAGGESGPKARPPNPNWFRSLRDQCQAAGVNFFFKQWGEFGPAATDTPPYLHHIVGMFSPEGHTPMVRVGKARAGRLLDGRTWDEFPSPAHQEA